MTTDQQDKVRENRARRAAARQGLILKKNPRRDPRAADYGSYMLVDDFQGNLIADFGWAYVGSPTGADHLADAEAYLNEMENAVATKHPAHGVTLWSPQPSETIVTAYGNFGQQDFGRLLHDAFRVVERNTGNEPEARLTLRDGAIEVRVTG